MLGAVWKAGVRKLIASVQRNGFRPWPLRLSHIPAGHLRVDHEPPTAPCQAGAVGEKVSGGRHFTITEGGPGRLSGRPDGCRLRWPGCLFSALTGRGLRTKPALRGRPESITSPQWPAHRALRREGRIVWPPGRGPGREVERGVRKTFQYIRQGPGRLPASSTMQGNRAGCPPTPAPPSFWHAEKPGSSLGGRHKHAVVGYVGFHPWGAPGDSSHPRHSRGQEAPQVGPGQGAHAGTVNGFPGPSLTGVGNPTVTLWCFSQRQTRRFLEETTANTQRCEGGKICRPEEEPSGATW